MRRKVISIALPYNATSFVWLPNAPRHKASHCPPKSYEYCEARRFLFVLRRESPKRTLEISFRINICFLVFDHGTLDSDESFPCLIWKIWSSSKALCKGQFDFERRRREHFTPSANSMQKCLGVRSVRRSPFSLFPPHHRHHYQHFASPSLAILMTLSSPSVCLLLHFFWSWCHCWWPAIYF